MAEFTAWIETNVPGSECRRIFEVPDEEIEGLDEAAQHEVIRSYAQDVAFEMCDWGYDDVVAGG